MTRAVKGVRLAAGGRVRTGARTSARGTIAAMATAAIIAGAWAGGAAAGPMATGSDAIHLRGLGLLIGDVRIESIDGDRVWYERPGRERGSIPLTAVESVVFASAPALGVAEDRARRGDMAGAAAAVAHLAGLEGPAADWAARRAIQWLGATDPAAALRLAGERMLQDGDPRWLVRQRTSFRAGRAGVSDGATARSVLRQVRRWRQLVAEGAPPGSHGVPVGAVIEVRRALAELERRAEVLVHEARRRGDDGSAGHQAAGGAPVGDDDAEPGPSGRTGRRPTSEVEVLAALRDGRAGEVFAALKQEDGPRAAEFGPETLAELARAAEADGRPVMAAAAWLRCGILHPRAPGAAAAWEAAARLHETQLGDPRAGARIREHARTAVAGAGEDAR